jgi:arylsulfatase A-like enzyme
MGKTAGFLQRFGLASSLFSLCLRLSTLAIAALVFVEALVLARGKAQGWTFYISSAEVAFEAVVRLAAAALAGIAMGVICTALLAPVMWRFPAARKRLAEMAVQTGIVLVLFFGSQFALSILINWAHLHGRRLVPGLFVAHFLAFAAALYFPRIRNELIASLDFLPRERVARRVVIATGASLAALILFEFAVSLTILAVKAAPAGSRPKTNILLVTFDALSAEDLSLYGYKLPTTPNIDSFASKSSVFTNYYSISTFTTPGVAAMLTGRYPSENGVFQLQGRLRPESASKTLPHVLRGAGYATAGFFSNPFAHYLARQTAGDFNLLPEPVYQDGGSQRLWKATLPLHQNTGIGSRVDEYHDLTNEWNSIFQLPLDLPERYTAAASFREARELLRQLPDGFFLWVHVMTPHDPYLPDPADLGRFLPVKEMDAFTDDDEAALKPHYPASKQALVTRRRLIYDEFIATADRAFGSFLTDLERSGKLRDTAVIVSADHGESFEGGVYEHESSYLTRPMIHVPLIIRTPGQQEKRVIKVTADQTALAPTIAELAGLPRPDGMRGRSLVEWLGRDGEDAGEGLAFSQFLERNSAFAPLRHGTFAAIDGSYEYVLNLDTRTGALRPLKEAEVWNVDCTSDNPKRAEELRAALYARFPGLPRNRR